MFSYFKGIIFLLFFIFSSQAFSQNYSISFNFPSGGVGAISFDYPVSCTHCQFSQMSNFKANFQLSGNTWNQTNIVTPISPTFYLEFDTATNQWYMDDSDIAILAGAPVVVFNNGTSQLTFTKGLAGIAQLNGIPIVGNFIARNSPVAVPSLSTLAIILLTLALAFNGFFFSRRTKWEGVL